MYVRWKRRRMTGPYLPDGSQYAISAVLVESRRVNGKPRQKVIKHLGCIRESGIIHVGHRIGFWQTAAAAFKALNLPPEQQHAIEQALQKRVPFPSQQDRQREREEMAALEARIKRLA